MVAPNPKGATMTKSKRTHPWRIPNNGSPLKTADRHILPNRQFRMLPR